VSVVVNVNYKRRILEFDAFVAVLLVVVAAVAIGNEAESEAASK